MRTSTLILWLWFAAMSVIAAMVTDPSYRRDLIDPIMDHTRRLIVELFR